MVNALKKCRRQEPIDLRPLGRLWSRSAASQTASLRPWASLVPSQSSDRVAGATFSDRDPRIYFMPWLIVPTAARETDCGPADDPAGNGVNQVKPAPIRSNQKTVVTAIRADSGPCAVGVHRKGAAHRACEDHAVHACRVTINQVPFSIVGGPPDLGDGPNTHDGALAAQHVGPV